MTLIKAMSAALVCDESMINIKLGKSKKGGLKAVITASLGQIPEDSPEAVEKAYYALSTPLSIEGSSEEIEATICTRIGEYQQVVSECVDTIKEMRKQIEEAKKTKSKATPKPSKKGQEDLEEEEDEAEEVSGASQQQSVLNSDNQKDY